MTLRYYRHTDGELVRALDNPGEDWSDLGPVPGERIGHPEAFDGGDIAISIAYYEERMRRRRDLLLWATDPTQQPAREAGYRASWETWRQALRDMPETADPMDPSWPAPPDEGELDRLVSSLSATIGLIRTL